MIVRLWHGKTSSANAEEYMNYILKTGIKDYRKVEILSGLTADDIIYKPAE